MWFDGEFIEDAQARVSPLSHSLHYGGAVYEGIRFYEFPHNFWRSVFRLQDHINRLLVSAQVMDMESPYGAEELCEAVLESVKKSDLQAGYIRPAIFRGEGIGLMSPGIPVHTMIAVLPWAQGPDSISLATSKMIRLHPRSTSIGAKVAGHYVNSYLAAAEAKKSRANDALLLDYEDNVAETSIANVFFVKGETIFTPKTENIFPGITRDTILYLCHGEERDVSLQEAKEADAMFVTGTACEVLPVARLDDKVFDTENPLVRKIRAFFGHVVDSSCPVNKPWLSTLEPTSWASKLINPAKGANR